MYLVTMLQLQSTHFTGPSSQLAKSLIIERADHFLIAISLSGPQAQEIADQIKEKINHSEIDSPSSFMSLLERVQEQWTGVFGELSAVYSHEGKIYLLCKNGEIWLHRGEKFGRVLSSSDELKVVEGRVQDRDTYLVLTQSAVVALYDLFTSVTEFKLQFTQAVSLFQEKIHFSGLSDRCAVGLIETQLIVDPHLISSGLDETVNSSGDRKKAISERLAHLQRVITQSKPHIQRFFSYSMELVKRVPELKQVRLSQNQRRRLAVGFLAIAIIGVIILGSLAWRATQIRKGEAFILPFQQRLSALQAIADVDSVSARDQVLVLQKEFESQRSPFDTNLFTKKMISEYSTQVESFIKDVSGKVELQTLPIFYDFRLVQADFIASRADTDKNIGIFLDLEKQVAISLTMDSKQQTVLPIGEYPGLKDLSYSEEQLYLLSDGVYTFPIDSKNPAEKNIPEGDSNRDGKFLRTFGEFVYVLNPEKRNLYRYTLKKDDDEAEPPQPIGWFQDKKDLDFPSITSFAIDGNVWLGTQQGQILRYERGNPIAFNIQGLQETFSSPIKIYTKEELDSIFVIESAKNRVVRLSKDGVFLKQIQSPSLGAATDIIFSSTTGKAYALAGSLVYELAL